MFAHFTYRKGLLLLLCGVLLVLRIGGVHMHLCFDGQEPPVTLHVLDSGLEHQTNNTAGEHQDENIDDGSASSAKSPAADLSFLPLLLVTLALWLVLPQLTITRARAFRRPAFHSLTSLLPPLRGPPATTLT